MFLSFKNRQEYFCEICDYKCCKPCDFSKHLLTAKHKSRAFTDKKVCEKVAPFDCSFCNYFCKSKTDFNKHLNTKKHKMNVCNNESPLKNYSCMKCKKMYDKYNSYWHHIRNCNTDPMDTSNELYVHAIHKLIEENKDLRNFVIEHSTGIMNKLVEQNSKIMDMTNNVNIINHNTMNNKFNINVFLNEQCKNAMNLTDFVKNIQITNEDIENNGELGFVGGISKIFLDNLKQLSVYERPIHCTDIKRETMYIKNDDKWQKEEDKTKLQKAITEISRKSVAKINEWKIETPEYENMDSPEFMRGIVMSRNSMAGYNRESYADKIIRLLAKETMVDKNNLLLT